MVIDVTTGLLPHKDTRQAGCLHTGLCPPTSEEGVLFLLHTRTSQWSEQLQNESNSTARERCFGSRLALKVTPGASAEHPSSVPQCRWDEGPLSLCSRTVIYNPPSGEACVSSSWHQRNGGWCWLCLQLRRALGALQAGRRIACALIACVLTQPIAFNHWSHKGPLLGSAGPQKLWLMASSQALKAEQFL